MNGAMLEFGSVRLRFADVAPGNPARGVVASHRFRVEVGTLDVGRINFRARDTEHVVLFAGHVGFGIDEEFRGHGYARQACLALVPFALAVRDAVILTCDVQNVASRRTLERLGATFLDERDVPAHDPQYERGSRRKRRYAWVLPR